MNEMPADVKSLLKDGAALTDKALEALLPSVETVPASIHGAMRHSVFAGGKRLRPVLAMQAAATIAGAQPAGAGRAQSARCVRRITSRLKEPVHPSPADAEAGHCGGQRRLCGSRFRVGGRL